MPVLDGYSTATITGSRGGREEIAQDGAQVFLVLDRDPASAKSAIFGELVRQLPQV